MSKNPADLNQTTAVKAVRRRRRKMSLALGALLALMLLSGATNASATGGSSWWKADLHVHSVFSADAYPDLGILTNAAKARGYNAIFLTDHNLASNFPISGLTANHMVLDDTLDSSTGYFRRWTKASDGSLTSSTNAVVTSPVFSGSRALKLSAASSSAGETFAWTKRGPSFRTENGTTTLKFSVYPTLVNSGSSLYVSAAIGGDPTIKDPSNNPVGYTAAGMPQPGKSTVLIWYLGAPPPTSLFPGAHVYETSLGSYTLNAWNTYSINATAAVQALPASDQPLDYDALSDLKIAAVGNGGTATGVFDAYSSDAPTGTSLGESLAADEFVYRNSLIDSHAYDTSTFKLLPSLEMGVNEHAQRFNFDITSPSQFVSYSNGIDGIAPTQQTGYPAQLNHPGVAGGVSDSQATSTNAEGADLMEVRQQNMINDWDSILRQNVTLPPIGTWGADNHIGSWSVGSQSTFIRSPSLDFNSLIQAMYEGRLYLGKGNFTSGLFFNLGSSATEPYPARYPVYIPASQSTTSVTLAIGGGLQSGSDSVRWLSNGSSSTTTSVIFNDTPGATTYTATKAVPTPGPSTYVRAEVRDSGGSIKAMSEPIMFKPVSGLPTGMSYHVQQVTNPGGTGYDKLVTDGITASSWDGTNKHLSLSLKDAAGALVELRVTTGSQIPSALTVDGSSVAAAPDLATFQASTGSSWFYDAAAHLLYLKAKHTSTTASVVASFNGSSGGDNVAPSIPTNLTAQAVGSSEIDLTWTASTDNVGVAGYHVFRDGGGTPIATVTSTSYNDTGLAANSTHTYTVSAFDAAGNESAQSAPATATTGSGGGPTTTFTPVADSYVDSSAPTTNHGASTSIRVDASPTVKSYLKFSLTGLSGTVTNAILRVYANSSQSVGYDAYSVADNSWTETGITYANAPPFAATNTGSSGPVTTGTWTTVNVTPLVSGNGTISIGLATTSATALSLSSHEGANPPQLVVTTS